MQKAPLLAFVAGLVVGAAVLWLAGPCSGAKTERGALVDGRYLVLDGPSGHWIYEKGDKGLTLVGKQMTPSGLKDIWGLQGSFLPQSLAVGNPSEMVLNVPMTRYSTETGMFQVVHKIYRSVGGRLVEMPMDSLPGAAPEAPGSGPAPGR